MKRTWFLILVLILSSWSLFNLYAEATPYPSSPPAAPKTVAQIQSEAYALQTDIRNNAGRKTDRTQDGHGTPVITGHGPASGGNVWVSSTWDKVNVTYAATQTIHLAANNTLVTLLITHSYINGGNLNGVLTVLDTTSNPVYVWDGTTAARITIRNSTLTNFYAFVKEDSAGLFRVGAAVVILDNVTMVNFDTTMSIPDSTSRTIIDHVQDSTITNYNKGNTSLYAFQDAREDAAASAGIRINRVLAFNGVSVTTGGIGGNNIAIAKGNYINGGFNGFVFGGDGSHGASPNFGNPTEWVNWSHNYMNASSHTVFGFYGSAFGAFAAFHLGRNAYATISNNYINNSKYITIQSSGNQTGFRILGNYLQGPSATFTESIGIFSQNHDFTISGNYLWNLNTTHNTGILLAVFVYNVTVSNNVIYNVGKYAMAFQSLGLKFKDPLLAFCEPDGCSDYSWKGMSISVRGNYISDNYINAAIQIDSGYIQFQDNTVVNSPAGIFELIDGWNCVKPDTCDVDSYIWVDWANGWPSGTTASILWPSVVSKHEKDFWLRDMRTGLISVQTPIHAYTGGILSILSSSSYWGTLQSPRCVQGPLATDADVLKWTGHSCGVVSDTTNTSLGYNVPFSVIIPGTWVNKTLQISMNPSAQISWSSIYDGAFEASDNSIGGSITVNIVGGKGTWGLGLGHDYSVGFGVSISIQQITDWAYLLIFFFLITMGLLGAFAIRRKRSG